MSSPDLATGSRPTAVAVCQGIGLSDAAAALLTDQQRPEEFFALLTAERLDDDAIRVAARALPKPKAVWWACLCLWELYRPQPPAAVDAALQAVVRWIREPGEDHRRQAEAAGQAAGIDQPAGLVALAAFYSDGSIAPPGLPPVPPAPELTGKLIVAALLLALDRAPADRRPANQRLFVTLAGQVGGHSLHWERPLQPAKPR